MSSSSSTVHTFTSSPSFFACSTHSGCLRSIKGLGLTGIDYSMRVLRKHPEWVEQAKKLGLEVNVWTVDEEEDMRYFIDLGVDYITTDYPERLQALLK